MHVPLTLVDFLDRAATVYGDRVAIVDEPEPPGGGLGQVTYAGLAAMARSLAAALDARGVPAGARVAIVAPNSARFLAALFGVSAYGRVLVPINFRLNDHEIRYILEHAGATVALVDPDCEAVVPADAVAHRLVLGHAPAADLFGRVDAAPRHAVTDEAAPVSINYTSGTTARALLFAPVVAIVFAMPSAGPLLWLGVGLALADQGAGIADALSERDSRATLGGLGRGEYALHVALVAVHATALTLALAARPTAAWSPAAPMTMGAWPALDLLVAGPLVGGLAVAALHVALAWRHRPALGCCAAEAA